MVRLRKPSLWSTADEDNVLVARCLAGAIAVYVAPIALNGRTARVICKPNE